MDFLDGFFSFLQNAWDDFTYWLEDIISKIIDSVTNWIKSIHKFIKQNDIIVTTGPTSFRVPQNALQNELSKHNFQAKEMNDSNKAAIFDQLLLSAKRENEHSVPLTSTEKARWENSPNKQLKMYQITNK